MARAPKPSPRVASRPSTADRDRTLQAFREAYTVPTEASGLSAEERAEDGIPADAADRVAVRGIAPSHLMAARWCTMMDAVHAIGRRVYKGGWTPSIFADKPHFPYPDPTRGLVFRQVAWNHRPRDRSWRTAFGAYALLCDALAEGVVRAVAESLGTAVVPPSYDGAEHRSVYVRERVPIDAADWRRDAVLMTDDLIRSWWCITAHRTGGKMPSEPPWVVLIERESLAELFVRYPDVLTEEAATDAVQQRGRKRSVPLEVIAAWILPRWHRGELGPKMMGATKAIEDRWSVPRGTADQWRKELGICKGGRHETQARDVEINADD
jgi:hypothetical protein